jgi:MFS family permease
MIARVLLALATVADPFYVVYARHEWNAPAEAVGLYLGASSAAVLASNFIWGPLGDRAGNRLLMTLTVLSIASVPLAALVITFLRPAIGLNAAVGGFTLVFVLGGLAIGSGRIVNNNMLLAIAPPAERAIYIGFLNTLLGIVTFVPPFGGALVDLVGFVPLFALTLLIAASALLASLRLSPATGNNSEI